MPRYSRAGSKKQFVGAVGEGKKEAQTVKIPAIGSLLFRGTAADKDQRFINGYFDVLKNPETNKTYYYFTKRPGLNPTGAIRPKGASGVARGCESWNNRIYSVYDNKIYSDTTDLGVTLTTSTGRVGITITRPGAANQYICINDGVKLYVINAANTVTTVTVNFPTPNTTDLVYMDGYICTLKTDGTVWACNVDDPTTWDASHFLTAQMFGGTGVGIAHQNNLLFVFLDNSMQAFYDAQNATGSPFSNYEQAAQQIGCASQNSIAQDEQYITWVSNSRNGGFSVYRIDGSTGLKEIATPAIQRILNNEKTGIATCFAFAKRVAGRFFYVLNLMSANRTFVYDYGNDLWTEYQEAGATNRWPIVSVCQHNYQAFCQHATDGYIYPMDAATYQDNGVNFTYLMRLARVDFDTASSRKFCSGVNVVGDVQSDPCNIFLQYSDDDYATTSTARTLSMSNHRVFATQFGSFFRRSWQVSYTGNTPMRIEALELEVSIG
jgi:hypothetical protein